MRVVLDTNVVASALLEEFARIVARDKFAKKLAQKNLSAAEIVASYREVAESVEAAPIEAPGLRDPDDAAVLACAVAAGVDAIVSGDGDLHALGSYRGIPVLTAAECLRRITA